MRAVDRGSGAGGGLAQTEAVHGGRLENRIAVQGLFEHVLGRDVGGVAEVWCAGARDGRLRAFGETRRDLARCTAVLGKSQLPIGVGVGGSKAVDCLALVKSDTELQR